VSSPTGVLLGLDIDEQALTIAKAKLAKFGERAIIVHASYESLSEQLQRLGWEKVDGILLDLGVSSLQLDTAERGFSFQYDAPLDMRFDRTQGKSAMDLVNDQTERELADILSRYGEEPFARSIAREIVRSRPITTTRQLAELVAQVTRSKAYGKRSKSMRPGMGASHGHPATLTFQALRIAVNHELEAVEVVLPQAISSLATGGRLAVISFHSLEDRLVKTFFRRESQDCICPPRQPICTCGHKASLVEINRRPLRPAEAEIKENPRSRSARLRIAEKIE
jgi:16S rRNA (cytosine1402-N4)-methyltransferase